MCSDIMLWMRITAWAFSHLSFVICDCDCDYAVWDSLNPSIVDNFQALGIVLPGQIFSLANGLFSFFCLFAFFFFLFNLDRSFGIY